MLGPETDLYVGTAAPARFEKNWVPSVPSQAWFAYFRLYAGMVTQTPGIHAY